MSRQDEQIVGPIEEVWDHLRDQRAEMERTAGPCYGCMGPRCWQAVEAQKVWKGLCEFCWHQSTG